MANVITVQIEGALYKGMAEHVGLELMGFGDGVRAVTVTREDGSVLHWAPEFLPGDRVTWKDEDVVGDDVGTVTEMRRTLVNDQTGLMFRVQWDSVETAGGICWMNPSELVKLTSTPEEVSSL